MDRTISILFKNLINLIYPIRCEHCGSRLDPLHKTCVCAPCIEKIKKNPGPYCKICGRSISHAGNVCPECNESGFHFKSAHSVCLHEGVVKKLIHAFKYRNKRSLAAPLAHLMAEFLRENREIMNGIDLITFVPIQKKRLYKRGYNQSEVLARSLSAEFGIPLISALEKTRSTKPQNELSRIKRLANLKYTMNPKKDTRLDNLKILLIDDVMATGATLDESSRALLDFGALEVKCLTLSRGI